MRPTVPRLLLVTDPAMEGGIVATVRAALEGAVSGRVGVQLRAKDRSARALVELGRTLRALTRDAGAALFVNGRLDVAEIVDADGVHLPEAGFSVADARALLGQDRLVGRSCHDRAGLEAAAAAGADYATLSPVLGVPGKGAPLGLEGFSEICRGAPLPTLALGGVDVAAVASVLAAGAHGVAVIRAVGGPTTAASRVRSLLAALDRSGRGTR